MNGITKQTSYEKALCMIDSAGKPLETVMMGLYNDGTVEEDDAAVTEMVEKRAGEQSATIIIEEETAAEIVEQRPKIERLNKAKQINGFILFVYRLTIMLRFIILCQFFRFRISRSVKNAHGLWLVSVICEIWFGVSWIFDQFPKWKPMTRKTNVNALRARFWNENEPCTLDPIDVFVSTVDPMKEPPLVTANTVLSILAVDYPTDKVSCYISDDGASLLTSETTILTASFARLWVPFCKKYKIEPRAPEVYFSKDLHCQKELKKRGGIFIKEWRVMKRWYGEFREQIKTYVDEAEKMPGDGWKMRNGVPWPGNDSQHHAGMIQVFLGPTGKKDVKENYLPKLVYVSREKNPTKPHHKKAGAMNALVRASGILSNGPYILNVDCDHYFNNSCALLEAMCFMMDPKLSRKICFVQFPQRFDGIDKDDRYANRNVVFFDVNMKGLDGLQGPAYVGTGCCFSREAIYGFYPISDEDYHDHVHDHDHREKFRSIIGRIKRRTKRLFQKKRLQRVPRSRAEISRAEITGAVNEDGHDDFQRYGDDAWLLLSQDNLKKRFGSSSLFMESTFMENGGLPPSANPAFLLDEAIRVVGCNYEDNCDWGKEIGWIYGSVTEDILTGFKMHTRGWRSIYCMPSIPAFKGTAPINLTYRLDQVMRWALGSVEILFSRHCPIWYGYGGGLYKLQRVAYINTVIYPLTSLPLGVYCVLPAICLISGKFITPTVDSETIVCYSMLFGSVIITGALENIWGGIGLANWWKNEQFWVIGGTSAHLIAVIQGLLKLMLRIDTNFTVTSKATNADGEDEFAELSIFRFGYVLLPPITIIFINILGLLTAISNAINYGHHQTMTVIAGKITFAVWVIVHFIPFLKGLRGKTKRVPTIICVWSFLLASMLSLLWVQVNSFIFDKTKTTPHH